MELALGGWVLVVVAAALIVGAGGIILARTGNAPWRVVPDAPLSLVACAALLFVTDGGRG
jgi:hypothetical protein